MKTMCLPGYHHNGFVATHALGHMMYSLPKCKLCVSWITICIYVYNFVRLFFANI